MIRSYEKNGRFFFEDEKQKIETTELIECELVVQDQLFGYLYKSKAVKEYEKD
ncbi:MAG: hypothetical protein GX084_03615 [Acholeplasmataceae bacterium]|jgi:hypothetical protein|nr:hypothetical protein [Acidaminococcaceae bacterium]NLY83685.1 hypothetical protein [Acholeplasmataceae bacterium]